MINYYETSYGERRSRKKPQVEGLIAPPSVTGSESRSQTGSEVGCTNGNDEETNDCYDSKPNFGTSGNSGAPKYLTVYDNIYTIKVIKSKEDKKRENLYGVSRQTNVTPNQVVGKSSEQPFRSDNCKGEKEKTGDIDLSSYEDSGEAKEISEHSSCICGEDDDEDNDDDDAYAKIEKELGLMLQNEVPTNRSETGNVSPGGDIDLYNSESGTTCDDIISQSMGKSSVDVYTQPCPEHVKLFVYRSTPNLQKNKANELVVLVKTPDVESKKSDVFFSADREIGLDNNNNNSPAEFEDATDNLSDADPAGVYPKDRVTVTSPINTHLIAVKRTDICQELTYDHGKIRRQRIHGSMNDVDRVPNVADDQLGNFKLVSDEKKNSLSPDVDLKTMPRSSSKVTHGSNESSRSTSEFLFAEQGSLSTPTSPKTPFIDIPLESPMQSSNEHALLSGDNFGLKTPQLASRDFSGITPYASIDLFESENKTGEIFDESGSEIDINIEKSPDSFFEVQGRSRSVQQQSVVIPHPETSHKENTDKIEKTKLSLGIVANADHSSPSHGEVSEKLDNSKEVSRENEHNFRSNSSSMYQDCNNQSEDEKRPKTSHVVNQKNVNNEVNEQSKKKPAGNAIEEPTRSIEHALHSLVSELEKIGSFASLDDSKNGLNIQKRESKGPSEPIEIPSTPQKKLSYDKPSLKVVSYDSPFASTEEDTRSSRKPSLVVKQKERLSLKEIEESSKSDEDLLAQSGVKDETSQPTSTQKISARNFVRHFAVDFQKDISCIPTSLVDIKGFPKVYKAKWRVKTRNQYGVLERITFYEDFKIDSCYLNGDMKLRNTVLGFIGHRSLQEALLRRGAGDLSSIVRHVDRNTINFQLLRIVRQAHSLMDHFSKHVKDYNNTMKRLNSKSVEGERTVCSQEIQHSIDKLQASKSAVNFKVPSTTNEKTSSVSSVSSIVQRDTLGKHTPAPATKTVPKSSYFKNSGRFVRGTTYIKRGPQKKVLETGGRKLAQQRNVKPRYQSNRAHLGELSHAGDSSTSTSFETPAGVSIDSGEGHGFDSNTKAVFLKINKSALAKNTHSIDSVQHIQRKYNRKSFRRNFLPPLEYISQSFPQNSNLNTVSESFSVSPRKEQEDEYVDDADLKFEAFKYFIRALFSRIYGPDFEETQIQLKRLWRRDTGKMNGDAGFHNKEETKSIVEEFLGIKLHKDIYDVFWESIGLDSDSNLYFSAFLEKARDWGMILADDDQYRCFVINLMKKLRHRRFYEDQRNIATLGKKSIELYEVAEFLGSLSGVVVSPAQAKQLLTRVSYDKDYYTEVDIIQSLSNKFQHAFRTRNMEELLQNVPIVH